MIERATAYKSSDGAMFNELAACQKHEIEILWPPGEPAKAQEVAVWVMENAVKIVDVLTTTATSKPKARKANGGTKVRKPKVAAAPESPDTERSLA